MNPPVASCICGCESSNVEVVARILGKVTLEESLVWLLPFRDHFKNGVVRRHGDNERDQECLLQLVGNLVDGASGSVPWVSSRGIAVSTALISVLRLSLKLIAVGELLSRLNDIAEGRLKP